MSVLPNVLRGYGYIAQYLVDELWIIADLQPPVPALARSGFRPGRSSRRRVPAGRHVSSVQDPADRKHSEPQPVGSETVQSPPLGDNASSRLPRVPGEVRRRL